MRKRYSPGNSMQKAMWDNVISYGTLCDLDYSAAWLSQAYKSGRSDLRSVFYVDAENGDDDNLGRSWEEPLATIDAAMDPARYDDDDSIDYTDKRHRTGVFVAPGHYNESVLFSGYNIDLIGVGPAIPGKDYGCSINYDGAIDTTCVLGFSGSGNRISGFHIYCAEAIPAIYMAGGDNNLVENCVIECDGTNATYGIYAAGMKGSWIRNCVILNPVTAGIYVVGGADTYAINGGIEGNQIYAAATGAKGILTAAAATLVAYNFRINKNFIDVESGGATSIGIHQQNTGRMWVTDNYIVCHTTGITDASHGSLNNHVSASGTVTDPADDD